MKRSNFVTFGVSLIMMGGCLSLAHADEMATGMTADMATSTAAVSGHPGRMWTKTIHITATVVAIDKTKRTLSLKGPDGNVIDLQVNEAVQRFDAVNMGDSVSTDYLESIAVYIQKPGDVPAVSGDATYLVAAKGKMPGGIAATSQQITATVTNINYKTREITLKGPKGNSDTIIAGPEIKRFAEIKKGDQVVMNYTTAVAIAVNKAS